MTLKKIMKKAVAWTGCLWGCLVATSLAYAENSVLAITAQRSGNSEQVRIEFAQELTALPKAFATRNPARIALDFPGLGSALGMGRIAITQALVDSAIVAQSDERSRVVINLRQPANYRLDIVGKSLIVALEPITGAVPAQIPAAVVPAPTPAPSPAASSALAAAPITQAVVPTPTGPAPISDIQFRRGSDGAGRVVVTLPGKQVSADVRQVGSNLIVDFSNVSLPERLRKKLDVTDFATPVQSITTNQNAGRVRMQITPLGAWEHTAYQTDTELVLEVRQVNQDAKKAAQKDAFTGEKLSLNFQSIDVRQVLQVIADFTNFNVVTSDSVSGTVTLRVQNVPWDQILDIIMRSKGLAMRKNGNVLWVAPKDEIAAKEKLEFESQITNEKIEPLRTQSFQLNYAKASDVAPQLMAGGGGAEGGAGRILSARGSVIAEPRTNQLFVTDVAAKLDQVAQLIAKVDVSVRQVLIEARIVEATSDFARNLGAKLGGMDRRAIQGGDGGYQLAGENRVAFGTNYANALGSSGATTTMDASSNFVNLPAGGAGGFGAASFAVTLFSAASNRVLALELSALESDGRGKIVSSPRVIAYDKTKAVIEQGTEVPYQMATSSGATAVSFRKAVLKLDVVPQITPDGNISLELDVSKDSVGTITASGPSINTKHIKTQVLVDNGGTVVIGGIYTEEQQETDTKVPFFGDLPGVGFLFQNKTKKTAKSETLVFITPKLISDLVGTR
jgi:type IV pilus assembly protein PilQ